MRLITSLPFGAPSCAVIPGRERDDEGFIETGQTLLGVDPPVRISMAAVKEMARFIGWVPPTEIDRKQQEIDDLSILLAQSEAARAEADAYIDGIDGLTKRGLVVRKAMGRPPKKAKAA